MVLDEYHEETAEDEEDEEDGKRRVVGSEESATLRLSKILSVIWQTSNIHFLHIRYLTFMRLAKRVKARS